MLSGNPLSAFNQRSLIATAASFAEIPGNWAHSRWLDASNRYAEMSGKLSNKHRVHSRDMRQYVAGSVIIHCWDGWSYLGRAISAALVGDHGCARHLGYYAELRAAMSILGAHGIGVLNNRHAVIGTGQRCRLFNAGGTHEFSWTALETWATNSDASNAIHTCVRAGGVPLTDWLHHFGVTPATYSAIATQWLRAWGLDLQRLAADRDARNTASYRPSAFVLPRPATAADTVAIVSRIWRSCEPTADSPFATLDRELIRASLRQTFQVTQKRSIKQARRQYRIRIEGLLHSLQPAAIAGVNWLNYLTDETADPLSLLETAAGDARPTEVRHALQVIARAVLLLRLASGVSRRLLFTVDPAQRAQLTAMLASYGEDRSLWSAGDMPANFQDLAQDPYDAITAIQSTPNSTDSYADLWRSAAQPATILGSMERTALWGVCA